MSREGVEGLPVERPGPSAANEEFTGIVNRRDASGRQGWDPYEVWRTRVRTNANGARLKKDRPQKDHPRDPRR